MRNLIITMSLMAAAPVYADLGIMDTVSETNAKLGASSLGITQVYDHPAQVNTGQFYVPVEYNRTNAEGNGAEHDLNYSGKSDIDYIPLNQLKGVNGTNGINGVAGVSGVNGTAGAKGDVGNAGSTGATGARGAQGVQGAPGRDAEAPAIDPRLDVEIRELDYKHWSISSFASFGMQSSTARYIVGQKLTLKLGSSYEQRELEKLRNDIKDAQLQIQLLGDK